jgi:dihydroorotate dehydrogenase
MRFLYQRLLKPLLFLLDPEWVHDAFVRLGELLGRFGGGRWLIGRLYGYRGPDASKIVDGIRYETPVLLAAGFDYNARLSPVLDAIGFGGEEVGSVTARRCEGNPKPRLVRAVRSRSLVVYKGLRNDGVDAVIERLRRRPPQPGFVLGVSIARTNDPSAGTSVEAGIEDYAYSLERLVASGVGDFYTINVSCPNVHGGESFADEALLDRLLARLAQIPCDKPIYAKMPIGVDWPSFERLVDVVLRHELKGVVIGNLNKDYASLSHPEEAPREYRGGLSGAPCFDPSNDLIRRTREKVGDRLTIMGCGGVFTPQDAMAKLRAGADLVQLITGMIFEGPHLMKGIARAYAASKAGSPTC